MSNKANNQAKPKQIAIVNVAVAIIHYKDQYLLGFRNAAQHQGNRYEFVGGKIDHNENAEQALVREVAEETGIAIHDNTIVKLGRLHHDYGDKQVSLQVYKIELTAKQYEQHEHCQYGLEGQTLIWVNKLDLLAEKYALPAANKTILEWLSVPATIAITYPLSHFSTHSDPKEAWMHYHQNSLAVETWAYIRVKETMSEDIVGQLMRQRSDIFAIVNHDVYNSLLDAEDAMAKDKIIHQQVVAHHLTHDVLMEWFDSTQDNLADGKSIFIPSTHPLIVSCHDAFSIKAANQLASVRLQQQLPPVIGAFLSPVLATQTHPDTEPLGWERWSELAQLADIPIIGLGGLSPTMTDQALKHGGISVAGIRQFLYS